MLVLLLTTFGLQTIFFFCFSERQSEDENKLQGIREIQGTVSRYGTIPFSDCESATSPRFPASTDGHAVPHSFWSTVRPVWIQIYFQVQSFAEGEAKFLFTSRIQRRPEHCWRFCISSPEADTFFEFSDRLESILARAYIWRWVVQEGLKLGCVNLFGAEGARPKTFVNLWFIELERFYLNNNSITNGHGS